MGSKDGDHYYEEYDNESCPRSSLDETHEDGMSSPEHSPVKVPPRPPQRITGRQAMRASKMGSQPSNRPAAKTHNQSRSQIVYNASLPRYRQWRGRHKFFCRGRLMMGPNIKQFLFSFSLSLATWITFAVFIYPEVGVMISCEDS